jgi:xanthine dehydrogenase accessory factor
VLPGAPPNITRVLRAPLGGHVHAHYAIGDRTPAGAIIATVQGDGTARPVVAPFAGVLRGIVHPTALVTAGMKIGDLDPRVQPAYCFTVSDKSLAIGGGVLEAILTYFGNTPAPVAPQKSHPAPPPRRRRR